MSTDRANDGLFPRYRDIAVEAGIRAQVGVRLFDTGRSQVVMERYQLNDQRAFAFLTRLSSTRDVKLRVVAQELVAELGTEAE